MTIISHAHKVGKRLMLGEELINDLEALCYHISLRLCESMTIGQRVESVSSPYYMYYDSVHFSQGPYHLFLSRLNDSSWFTLTSCVKLYLTPDSLCPPSIM